MTSTLTVGPEYQQYRDVLARDSRLPPAEWTFKSDPAYRAILEHVSPEQGEQYLDLIVSEFPEQWHYFAGFYAHTARENDALGRPVQASFDRLGTECSPTNLRYLWHALLFWQHISQLGLSHVDVVEIGGGYGGLALWIRRLASSQQSILRSYSIIDVHEAGAVQKVFCREVAIPVRVVDGTDSAAISALMRGLQDWPYLISAYAFSEFSAEVRRFYQHEVIIQCSHGMLLWNMIPLYEFTDETQGQITSEAERPLTGPGNLLVRF